MRAGLIFFDSRRESVYGSLRSVVAYLVLLVGYTCLAALDPEHFPMGWWLPVVMVIFCSAIGVTIPRDQAQALVIGASVGLLLFGTAVFFDPTSPPNAPLLLAGPVLGAVASAAVYAAFWNRPGMQTVFDPVTRTRSISVQTFTTAVFVVSVLILR